MTDGPIPLADAIRTKLEGSVGPVTFSDLRAHLNRDAVFLVASSLSLVTCGVAVAMDDVDAVQAWIASGELRKPSASERKAWEEQGGMWNAVVVQPFVLVQPATEPTA